RGRRRWGEEHDGEDGRDATRDEERDPARPAAAVPAPR
ncbi:MAG: hypothetical protein JWM93_2768, partial [Frankiales bacterium]|nr:hypothetical protein [Frankiales bacterium]